MVRLFRLAADLAHKHEHRRDPLLHLALACQNHLPRQSILVFQPAVPVAERIAAKRHENFSAIGKSLEDRVDFVSCFTFHVKRNRRIELVKWSRAYRSEEHTSELQSR